MAAAVLLAGGAYLLPSASADGAEPEVTMRVLDDASDAPAVLAEAAAEQSEESEQRRAARGRRAQDTDKANRIDDGPDESDADVELDTVLDHEQESESEIEDRDVPEDIEFEPVSEDEE